MLLIEILVLLAVFTAFVWLTTLHGPLGGIHWYPKAAQEKALALGLVTKERLVSRARAVRCVLLLIVAAIILGSVFLVNRAVGWSIAFGQIYGMLFVMNWYDAIVVDYLWVAKTGYWHIPELGDMPIAKPWSLILKERIMMSLLYIPIAALFGCIAFIMS
ncbi:MAG: hypothetical protein Q4D42_12285 [Eubacteriales bacterium]|nr:hypothetical protein [Eubacteriales bacterium]